MVGKLIKRIYKYDSVTLSNGEIVTASEVYVVNGKVHQIMNGIVTVNDKIFNFSVYPRINGEIKELTYNINSVPQDLDGRSIINQFISFVEEDVNNETIFD